MLVTAARRTIPRRSAFDLVGTLAEYLQNRSIRERSEYHEGKIKGGLMDYLETTGEIIEGGHRVLELDEPLHHVTYKSGKPKEQRVTGIKRQKRTSQTLDEDRTMVLLKELGLLDACTEIVVVLDEDAILAANYEGKISDEQLSSLYDEHEQYAFYLVTEDQ